MNTFTPMPFLASLWLLAAWLTSAPAAWAAGTGPAPEIRIIEATNSVELMPAGATTWVLTQSNQVLRPGDRLRTGPDSRVRLLWSDQSVLSLGPLAELEVRPPAQPGQLSGLRFLKGILSFFHRDEPGRIQVITRGATAGVRGTEFVLRVEEQAGQERVVLSVMDGEVELSNAQGAVRLTSQQQGVAETGKVPNRTAGFVAAQVLQWFLYYPAVLDLRELKLPADASSALRDSLTAYAAGDLLRALAAYPAGRQPANPSESVYHAALLLSVGQVEAAEGALNRLDPAATEPGRLADALRTVIATVKGQTRSPAHPPGLATELLASSYQEQSRAAGDASLRQALALAWRAADLSPGFGFAWARVAELEFSFGRLPEAEIALQKALTLTPRHAQALALRGFLLAARNQRRAAIEWFSRAIAVDPALGNAWLGRGLCRIRGGDAAEGRTDLLVAAAAEPQRSLLRSYLGKAWLDGGDTLRAGHELQLARSLDPNDPTSWLYAALLRHQENRGNEAIRDLEQSQRLNDNRALFRSRLLLDQDRAVRSANLASLYRDAGMPEVGLREATRAVTYDYTSDAAHLFISDSFNDLRDPTRFNLRQETVWFNELLLANLLAPVGAGRLSQTVTAQEYSRLFEADGLGLAGQTTWRSDDQFRQLASQSGTFGNSSWAFDLDYQKNAGVRPNNDLNSLEWYTTLKHQLTPADSVLALIKYEDYESGDNFQYYDPAASQRPHFRFEEHQEPILIGGFQHAWSPGVRTLLLGGRLVTEQKFSDRQARQTLLLEDSSGAVTGTDSQPHDVQLSDDLEIYTAEVNHIVQRDRITFVAGARWQGGDFEFSNSLSNSPLPSFFLPPVQASFSESFHRLGGYSYLTLEPVDHLWLTAGLAYDWIEYPENFRAPPQSAGTETRDQLGPKAALVWHPLPQATLRGMFTRSLGGVSLDESFRLEPTQLAGFPQAFRTVISESLVGSVEAPRIDAAGLALDLQFGDGTFGGLQWQHLTSEVDRQIGVFRLRESIAPFVPSTTEENLDYREDTLGLSLHRLFGREFAAGLTYRLTHAELQSTLPEIPAAVSADARRDESARLHEIGGHLLFNHGSGFFARLGARYFLQSNHGYAPGQPGDDVLQLDLQAGWRFLRRRAELSVGVMNLTDEDYQLNPLTLYSEMPRERVFFTRLLFRF